MFSPRADRRAIGWRLPIKLQLGISVLLSLCLVGCGEPTEVPEPTFELTMGTGRDAFEPLPDGGDMVLERGSQGLQHVYVSLRAPIAEGLHLIDVTITSNGRVFSSPTRINAPFLSVDGEDFSELVGQFVVVPEPADVLDAPAVIRARVELNDVEFGQVERSVRVRW